MTIGSMFAEDYSNYEERIYSTGSDELDEMLERAFCEGYEYAQREFAEEEEEEEDTPREKRKMSRGGKIAVGAGAGTAAAAGSVYGGKKLGEVLVREGEKTKGRYKDLGAQYRDTKTGKIVKKKKAEGAIKRGEFMERTGETMQKPADAIRRGYDTSKHFISDKAEKVGKFAKDSANKVGTTWKNMPKAGKAAVIAAPVVAAGAGTGIALKRRHDKKKNESK